MRFLPCLDSSALAASRRRELAISRESATRLGQSAVAAATAGVYENFAGVEVDFRAPVQAACAAKVNIPPDAPLPARIAAAFPVTEIQVANETTLGAARRLVTEGSRPLALNFANGVTPGGGFLRGARAQEETLCRSSALCLTLDGDPSYDTLILGAWGCGAFGSDPERTAADFREALEGEFRGAFSKTIFAITDLSPRRKFLGPFLDAFVPLIDGSDQLPTHEAVTLSPRRILPSS